MTFTVFVFDDPKKEHICEESDDDVVLVKDRRGRVIGFEPQSDALKLQIESFRIAADDAPVSIRGSKQLRRIEPRGLGVIGVHVRDHLGLRFDQGLGAGEIGEETRPPQGAGGRRVVGQCRVLRGTVTSCRSGSPC